MGNNIEQFNEVTALIFDYLYENFPKPTKLHVHELVGGAIDEYKVTVCSKTAFARDVMNWLITERFIEAHGGNFGMYSQCFLTAKGLASLNETPSSLGGKDTVISKIKNGLASGSKEAINSAIGASISALAAQL